MAQIGFNPNEYPDDGRGDFSPLPAGWYDCQIDNTEADSGNTWSGLKVVYKVVGHEHGGRLIFDRHIWQHQNPDSQSIQIGRRDTANMMRAAGQPQATDTQQVHGAMIGVKVKIKHQKGYEPKNEVQAVRPVGAQTGTYGGHPRSGAMSNQQQPAHGPPPGSWNQGPPQDRPAPPISDDSTPF